MNLKTKRIYEAPSGADGQRVLIDRLWPRGVSKEQAAIDWWAKELAPSDELRKWYRHEAPKWEEFRSRYFAELGEQEDAVQRVLALLRDGPVTLLFASRETERNNASALREFLESRT